MCNTSNFKACIAPDEQRTVQGGPLFTQLHRTEQLRTEQQRHTRRFWRAAGEATALAQGAQRRLAVVESEIAQAHHAREQHSAADLAAQLVAAQNSAAKYKTIGIRLKTQLENKRAELHRLKVTFTKFHLICMFQSTSCEAQPSHWRLPKRFLSSSTVFVRHLSWREKSAGGAKAELGGLVRSSHLARKRRAASTLCWCSPSQILTSSPDDQLHGTFGGTWGPEGNDQNCCS